MIRRLISLLLSLSTCLASTAQADVFSVEPRKDPTRKRSVFWMPAVSFLLPSFDQWFERQYEAGAIYAGTAGFGFGLAQSVRAQISAQEINKQDLHNYRDLERQYAYGSQLYMFAGELSTFHAFRTAVESRREDGEFAFLQAHETTADLLLAPFEFSQLARPTTYVPLGILATLGAIAISQRHHTYSMSDLAFTAGTSYNAGVGEEALFRGYMMPLLRDRTSNDFWSNTITALVFGAAHLSPSNRLPWPQTLLGWYFGWMDQRDRWSIRQSIFVHAWWDVMAIGMSLAQSDSRERVIPLPRLQFEF